MPTLGAVQMVDKLLGQLSQKRASFWICTFVEFKEVRSNADSANIDNVRDLCTCALFRKRSGIREL